MKHRLLAGRRGGILLFELSGVPLYIIATWLLNVVVKLLNLLMSTVVVGSDRIISVPFTFKVCERALLLF